MGWQPIETAPKDGTVIDVWLDSWTGPERVCDVFWGRYWPDVIGSETRVGWAKNAEVYNTATTVGIEEDKYTLNDGRDVWATATHWMPLPKWPGNT